MIPADGKMTLLQYTTVFLILSILMIGRFDVASSAVDDTAMNETSHRECAKFR